MKSVIEKCLGERERWFSIERDRIKWEKRLRWDIYRKHEARWIDKCRALNFQQMELLRSYREVSTTKWPWWIEKLSRIYRAYRNFLDGSRSCWAAIETNSKKPWWIEITITAIEKGSSRGCRDCSKTDFQRREKHRHECNQAYYLTKDPNNFLSSQNHLLTRKMSSI